MKHPCLTGADATTEAGTRHTGRGVGLVLVAVYGLFALAATGPARFNLADFGKAPLAYLLSALAVIYLVATVGMARGDRTSVWVARIAITTEMVGVLVGGLASYLVPAEVPRQDRVVVLRFGIGLCAARPNGSGPARASPHGAHPSPAEPRPQVTCWRCWRRPAPSAAPLPPAGDRRRFP